MRNQRSKKTRREQLRELLKKNENAPVTPWQFAKYVGLKDSQGIGGMMLTLVERGELERVMRVGPQGGWGVRIRREPMADLLREVQTEERQEAQFDSDLAKAISNFRSLVRA